MKKYLFASLLAVAFIFAFSTINVSVVHADVQCPGGITASTTCPFVGNGMPIANPTGWKSINPGQYDCPAWFTQGCVMPPSLFAKFGISL